MSDTQTAETIKILRDRLEHHKTRLSQNPDFLAVTALERTLKELGTADTKIAGNVPRLPLDDLPAAAPASYTQAGAAKAVLTKTLFPLQTKAILDGMARLGVSVGGKDPANNLVSILSKADWAKSISWKGTRGWWPTDRPLPNTTT